MSRQIAENHINALVWQGRHDFEAIPVIYRYPALVVVRFHIILAGLPAHVSLYYANLAGSVFNVASTNLADAQSLAGVMSSVLAIHDAPVFAPITI